MSSQSHLTIPPAAQQAIQQAQTRQELLGFEIRGRNLTQPEREHFAKELERMEVLRQRLESRAENIAEILRDLDYRRIKSTNAISLLQHHREPVPVRLEDELDRIIAEMQDFCRERRQIEADKKEIDGNQIRLGILLGHFNTDWVLGDPDITMRFESRSRDPSPDPTGV